MTDPHATALLWRLEHLDDAGRRAADGTAGRLFAGLAGAVRRLRVRRPGPIGCPDVPPGAALPVVPCRPCRSGSVPGARGRWAS